MSSVGVLASSDSGLSESALEKSSCVSFEEADTDVGSYLVDMVTNRVTEKNIFTLLKEACLAIEKN